MNRLLHANGVDLEDLGVGRESMSEEDNRNAFRILCEHWRDFAGTAMRYWLVDQLVGIFGVTERPSVETADHIYDAIAEHIAQPDFRPRALMDSFDIVFIATTDDPCDDLDGHARLAAERPSPVVLLPPSALTSTWNRRPRAGRTSSRSCPR